MKHFRVILCGHAASGKDHARKIFERQGFTYAVSYTTRPPRPGEVDGVDYHFITDEEAQRMILNDEFYEWVPFNGWVYGTSREQFNTLNLFIMTPGGIGHIKPEDRTSCLIMYFDIQEEIRRERLNKRVMPGDSIERRLKADEVDFENFTDFDIRINNPNF
jgi:guanylate kinase